MSRVSVTAEKDSLIELLADLAKRKLPPQTCPDINTVIKICTTVERDLDRGQRNCENDSACDVMSDAERELRSIETIMEKLRTQNEQLREIAEEAIDLARKAVTVIQQKNYEERMGMSDTVLVEGPS